MAGAVFGTHALDWSMPSGTGAYMWVADQAVPADPGVPYTGSVYAQRVVAGDNVQIYPMLKFYDASGTQLGQVNGTLTAVPVGGPSTRMSVTGTAPAGTASVKLLVYTTNTPDRTVVNEYALDGWQIEYGTVMHDWADNPTVILGSATLSGMGVASATGIRVVLGSAALSSLGLISYPRLILRPPVVDQPPLGANRLFFRYKLTRGETIIKRMDGTYYTTQYPSQVEMEAAAIAYLGGHEHPVDFAEAEALIAAGYRAYLSP